MRLTFKYYPRLSEKEVEIIEELSFHTTKLYNIVNYELREDGYKHHYETDKEFRDNWHCEYLHAQTRQQCFRVLDQNWKSYFASIKDYRENPSKYRGQPRPPRFKNHDNNKNEVIFTNQNARFRDGKLIIPLIKKTKEKFQVQSLNFDMTNIKIPVDFNRLQQVRLNWDNSRKRWCIIIVYRQEIVGITEDYHDIMGIDLGLNNLATITFKDAIKSYIIDGRYAKSKNSYYNREIARLTGIAMKQQGDSKYFKRTNRIRRLQTRRNGFIKDYIHKSSKMIVDLAIINKCKTIVIGDFSGIKQNNKAKSFVQIPQQELVDKIKYKAKLLGIEVVLQNEAYTSGCSALDLEEVGKNNYDKSRRVKRGLFKSNVGVGINADVNGSLNILRKYKKCTPRLVKQARDNGFMDNPIRLRVA